MSKKVVPFILAIPSFILLLVFKIIPALNTVGISIKNYSPFHGLGESNSVGMENYIQILQAEFFSGIFLNTFTLSFLSIFSTCLLAAFLIWCISSMPNRVIKTVSLIMISIPAFVPIASYIGVFFRAFSASGWINSFVVSLGSEPILFLAKKSFFGLIFSIIDVLRNVYIPVIIGVLACEREGVRFAKIGLVILIYALVRGTLFMSPDLETLLMVSNPLVYEKADVFDSVQYRTSLAQMQFSAGSTLWVIKTFIQLLINIAVFFIVDNLMPRLRGLADTLTAKVNKGPNSVISIFGYVLFAIGSIGVIAAVFFPLSKRFPGNTSTIEGIRLLLANEIFMRSFINSLLYSAIGSLLYAYVTLTLAMPLIVKTKIYPLLMVVVMSISNNLVGEYIFYRGLGMINTIFPVILSSISVIGAFALHFSVSGKFDETPELMVYLKASFMPLLTIVLLFFISTWGGFLYQLIYVTDRQFYGIGMFGRQIMSSLQIDNMETATEAIRAAFILISSIVPVALGTILISLNKTIPLLAFSAQSRKG